jgi:hypothetical protein
VPDNGPTRCWDQSGRARTRAAAYYQNQFGDPDHTGRYVSHCEEAARVDLIFIEA